MKTKIFILATILFAAFVANAQTEVPNWKKSGNVGLNLSQSHLSNWSAGGQSTVNWTSFINFSENYLKGKHKWDNNIIASLGYSHIGDLKAMKVDDKLELYSTYGYKAAKNLYYSLAFSFKTQFADGYDYSIDSTNRISGFMAPAYFNLGLGIDYTPTDYFSVSLLPAAARLTYVGIQELADSGAFGVDAAEYNDQGVRTKKGECTLLEFGAKVTAKLGIDLFENVRFDSKLELFSDYLHNPQNVKVDWQNLITLKVNSWLNANISTHLIYDDNILIADKNGKKSPRTQFKEVFSVGLMYKF
ncbi:MAG: DUF3078 domain-containing protein [Lentimicrobiaceae bacterium]|jgi:hypothetical protein|nr:DUF3078 domain-containing protein [Lentimicrobiaceae bacterium]